MPGRRQNPERARRTARTAAGIPRACVEKRADDPWWETHYPPNGWGCRCIVQQLAEADLDRYGYEVSPEAPPVAMTERTLNTPDGPVAIQVPEGIDPGWSYNVGKSAGRGADLLAQEKHGGWEPLHAPGGNRPADPGSMGVAPAQADLGPRAPKGDEEGLRKTLRTAVGGDEATFADPLGNRVNINQSIVDHMLEDPARRHDGREAYFPFIPEAIESPGEIWVGFARSEATGPSGFADGTSVRSVRPRTGQSAWSPTSTEEGGPASRSSLTGRPRGCARDCGSMRPSRMGLAAPARARGVRR